MISNHIVVLQPLTREDADSFYGLYADKRLLESFEESPFLPNETPVQFTERIISLCTYAFTIRPVEQPQVIIGDCALHHWNKEAGEIQIGGSLSPDYWGKGFMQAAFQLLEELASSLGASFLLGNTQRTNYQAIRLVEKMGFEKHREDAGYTIMRKKLASDQPRNLPARIA